MTILDALLQGIRFGMIGFGAVLVFLTGIAITAPLIVLLLNIIAALFVGRRGDNPDE